MHPRIVQGGMGIGVSGWNLAINLHRLAGATNIAKALRHHARDTKYPLTLLLTS